MNDFEDNMEDERGSRSDSLTEVLSLLFITVILLSMFLKILFG